MSLDGTLSANERNDVISAVQRRVRYKREWGMYAFNAYFHASGPSFREVFIFMKEAIPFWKQLIFSKTLLSKNKSHKIAYISALTTFAIVANFLEFKFMDSQFSLTIVVALLIGIIVGPFYGFFACVMGDFIGYIVNPAYIYMWWVALSTGSFALFSGLIFNFLPTRRKWLVFVKLAVICITTFGFCTIFVNSTGFYFYNKAMGFSTGVIDFMAERFGGETTFWAYVVYRLFFKGQIWNSLFNYTLLFIAVPALNNVKPLKLHLY